MPYISVKTTNEISKEKEAVLKAKMGKAIETIPGKSEAYLMVCFEDRCRLWLRGDNSEESAFVEVKIFGTSSKQYYTAMTKVICAVLGDELGISPERVYVTYSEFENWGWNNMNF